MYDTISWLAKGIPKFCVNAMLASQKIEIRAINEDQPIF